MSTFRPVVLTPRHATPIIARFTLRQQITIAAVEAMGELDAGELAQRYGVSRSAIYKRLARAGLAPKKLARGRCIAASQLGSRHLPLNLDCL